MKKFCVLIVLVLASVGNVCAEEKIRIVTTHSPPFSYEENGVVKGVSTEIVRTVLRETGFEAEIEVYPWARAYHLATSQPNTLIYLIERLPERESLFQWVGTITPLKTYLYKLTSRTDIQIQRFRDIEQYSIGVVREGGDHQYLRMRRIQNLRPVPALEPLITNLHRGRIDLIVAPELSFIEQVKALELNPEEFEKAYPIDELSVDEYMAFSKDTPEEIVNQFRDGLARIMIRGELEETLQKYLTP